MPLKPVSSSMGRFGLYNGGMDTGTVFVPDSSTIFEYFPDHGCELLLVGDCFAIRSLGCFWFHFGMLKKKVLMPGKLDEDYISLKKYLASNKKDLYPKVKFAAIYKADYLHFFGNLSWYFEKDRGYIEGFFANHC